MPHSLILQPGMSLGNGRYVLDRLLKQGRSSLTLKGTQISNGRSLIFKFPLQDQGLLPDHQQRFQQIWQRVGHFQHPYLQQTVDYLEEQGIPCLVLEEIAGKPLSQIYTHTTPLSEAAALRLIFQVAQGVQQLHDRSLIHGDLKPQNLIQHPQSKAIVLVDWGLFWQGWNSQPLSPYSAPEPFTPPQLRPSVDVYSLAACLYTLVTGHPPIAAAQQSTTPLVPPQSLIPGLTPMTQEAILQGMALNPDRRPKSIQAWLTLLPQPYSPAQLSNVQAAAIMPPSTPRSDSPDLDPSEPLPIPPPPQTVKTRVAAPRALTQVKSPSVPASPMSNTSANPQGSPHGSPLRALFTSLWVMAIAGGVGLTAGGLLRWQETQSSFAQSFFEKSQSFPAKEWPGTLDLEFPEDAPLPETGYANDSYPPVLDWSPMAPTVYPEEIAPSVDFSPYTQEAPVTLPEREASGEVGGNTGGNTDGNTGGNEDSNSNVSVDPSEPLPNVNSASFEDPLYLPEETSPVQESPETDPIDPPAEEVPPAETPPAN